MTDIKMKFENVYKLYGNKRVLNNLNLEVYDGEFLVVLGPSGMGKSTLLRTTVGIEDLTAGKIILDGKDISKLPTDKRNIAMVFQNYALYPNMIVRANIEFPLKMSKTPKNVMKSKVEAISETLKIGDILDKPISQISGGQKQRVALARCLVRDPKIFLLDEPLSNLDARVRYVARSELKKIQKDLGYTFVYVTHDQLEASTLSDRVGVLRDGKLEQVGPFENILNEPESVWLGDFVGEYPMNFISGEILDLPGKTVGFRDYWVKEGSQITTTVETSMMSELNYHLQCAPIETETNNITNAGRVIMIRTTERVESGKKFSFDLQRYNIYGADGKLEKVVK